MLVDMHVHSSGISPCAKKDVAGMIKNSKNAKLDGFVLCNHYTKEYAEEMGVSNYNDAFTNEFREGKKIGDALGFCVFFGIEVTLELYGGAHVLIYGVDDEFHKRHGGLYDMAQKELYETVKGEGGILVQAHPLRGGKNALLDPLYLDAVELNNHLKYEGPHREELCKFAHTHGIFVTSGGDYHADTRRTFCGVYFPDGLTDCRELKDHLLLSDSIELQLEDTLPRTTFVKAEK